MSSPEPEVIDDAANHRFVLREDGTEAQLVYRLNGRRRILVHTEVPEAIGGRGIGGRLVRAAVAHAEAAGETLAPWCPYAQKWLEDHPDVAGRVTIDWSDPPAA